MGSCAPGSSSCSGGVLTIGPPKVFTRPSRHYITWISHHARAQNRLPRAQRGAEGEMNQLSTPRRAAVITALVEGNSIRATCRMTGIAKQTVLDLLAALGPACAIYQSGA